MRTQLPGHLAMLNVNLALFLAIDGCDAGATSSDAEGEPKSSGWAIVDRRKLAVRP